MKVAGLPSFEGAPPGPSEAVVRPQNDFEVLFSRYKYVNLASAQQQYQRRCLVVPTATRWLKDISHYSHLPS